MNDTDDIENPGNGDEDKQNGAAEPASATADNGAAAPKLVISEKEYDKITQALVIRLRKHEETVRKDSSELPGMRQKDSMVHRPTEREKEIQFARENQTRY
ncbi:DNA replication licensing factor MCM6-like [Raphanus sativus]|uniref:DNA replication licensing factor MCM6-like n=1 Tax=Raphanus sativus TaxID=3726 RepID=A0A9W3BZZ6_RAPSA|nr:DNA replication licensing factor MCM6-like [Raphanus sativus]